MQINKTLEHDDDLQSFENEAEKIYGRVTKAMKEHNIQGYEWLQKVNLNSFEPLNSYSSAPKLQSQFLTSVSVTDNFDYFLSTQMIEKIVTHTNTKLKMNELEKAAKKSK